MGTINSTEDLIQEINSLKDRILLLIEVVKVYNKFKLKIREKELNLNKDLINLQIRRYHIEVDEIGSLLEE